MDKAEYIAEFLDSLTGQSLSLELKSEETVDGANQTWWKAVGSVKAGGTRNGKDWGEIEFQSAAYDVDSTTAFSVVLGSFVNFISSPDFHSMLLEAIEAKERGEEVSDEQG